MSIRCGKARLVSPRRPTSNDHDALPLSARQATRHADHGHAPREEDARRPLGRKEGRPAMLQVWDPKKVGWGVEGEAIKEETGVSRCAYQSIRSKSLIVMEDYQLF
jgi:hypothetical protein